MDLFRNFGGKVLVDGLVGKTDDVNLTVSQIVSP